MNVPAVKDETEQQLVPTAWRPVLRDLVSALVREDDQPASGIPGVAPLSANTVASIYGAIRSYGAVLLELPEETWQSSACMWYGSHWEVLVDLWAEGEGRSDLVLHLRVTEGDEGFAFKVHMVYVP